MNSVSFTFVFLGVLLLTIGAPKWKGAVRALEIARRENPFKGQWKLIDRLSLIQAMTIVGAVALVLGLLTGAIF